jgi:hypothetical protein
MDGYLKTKNHSRACVGDNDIVTGDGTMSIHDATRQLVVEVDGASTDRPTVPPFWVAVAAEKVTLPKLAKGARLSAPLLLMRLKSSTIHSALTSQRGYGWRVQVWVTLWPVDWFSITALPVVVLVTAIVTLMTFPALTEKPLKSVEGASSHSYQESKLTRVPVMQKSTPA